METGSSQSERVLYRKMYTTSGWARASKEAGFEKIEFQRNSGGPGDVTFQLKYCGVCHSDVHIAKDDLGNNATIL